MLNKLLIKDINYQFCVVFEEPFVDNFLSKRRKLISFYPKNQSSNKFIQMSNLDPVLSFIISWS